MNDLPVSEETEPDRLNMESIFTSEYVPRVGEQGQRVTHYTGETNYNVNRWTTEVAYFLRAFLKFT